jgi:hypothetical protein
VTPRRRERRLRRIARIRQQGLDLIAVADAELERLVADVWRDDVRVHRDRPGLGEDVS